MSLARTLALALSVLLAGLCLETVSGAAADEGAISLQQLQVQGRISVDSSLYPPVGIVARQKLALVLEIATDRWFAGGTRIEIPEVPGLVILQTEQFASNASETRGGNSWVLQRWTLDLFPQREGDFTVPPVSLQVKVNHETAGEISGTLVSPPISFSARRPQELAGVEHWVASPHYKVSQSFDRSLDTLLVGDAFEREIRFEAHDVMAMMLPVFQPEVLPGLATYPMPPEVGNSSNRGTTVASRVQRISYVVEAPGTYSLPAQDYFWWDTKAGELRLLTLPATEVLVGGTANTPVSAAQVARNLDFRQMLWAAGLALGLALLLAIARRLPFNHAAKLLHWVENLRWKLRELRKPALAERLNPDSSAGD